VDIWRGKRVLVTGADGFIGSHLVEHLLGANALVFALTRSTSNNGTTQFALRNLENVTHKLTSVITGNLANAEIINIVFDLQPEIIFHLGAEAYVLKSVRQPIEVFTVNALGTMHILEAARRLPSLQRVVITSSSEVYGSAADDRFINEDHQLCPTSPYGASKLAADRLAYSYYFTYGLPVAIIRPFNTYGPRHLYDVIPKFIKQGLRGDDLIVHGSGEQRRDFTYIDDMIEAFILMGSHPDVIGQVINFGTAQSYSINEIAHRIQSLTGGRSVIRHDGERVAEVRHLICDNRKALRMLNWKPKTSLEEGLLKNVEFERQLHARSVYSRKHC
jgi:nucleoside-diphosphate-sugar epimerase